jgi:hypothetical protein
MNVPAFPTVTTPVAWPTDGDLDGLPETSLEDRSDFGAIYDAQVVPVSPHLLDAIRRAIEITERWLDMSDEAVWAEVDEAIACLDAEVPDWRLTLFERQVFTEAERRQLRGLDHDAWWRRYWQLPWKAARRTAGRSGRR